MTPDEERAEKIRGIIARWALSSARIEDPELLVEIAAEINDAVKTAVKAAVEDSQKVMAEELTKAECEHVKQATGLVYEDAARIAESREDEALYDAELLRCADKYDLPRERDWIANRIRARSAELKEHK